MSKKNSSCFANTMDTRRRFRPRPFQRSPTLFTPPNTRRGFVPMKQKKKTRTTEKKKTTERRRSTTSSASSSFSSNFLVFLVILFVVIVVVGGVGLYFWSEDSLKKKNEPSIQYSVISPPQPLPPSPPSVITPDCTTDYCQSTFDLISKNSPNVFDPETQKAIPLTEYQDLKQKADSIPALEKEREDNKAAKEKVEKEKENLLKMMDSNTNCVFPVCTQRYPIQTRLFTENSEVSITCPSDKKICILSGQLFAPSYWCDCKADKNRGLRDEISNRVIQLYPEQIKYIQNIITKQEKAIFGPWDQTNSLFKSDPVNIKNRKLSLILNYVCLPKDEDSCPIV